MNSLLPEINLSTKARANGRISEMSGRSPLNRCVDLFVALPVEARSGLVSAIESRVSEVEARRASSLRRFNRTNSRLSARALREADIELAALSSALRRLAA